jgi:transmembrane sensor
MQKNLPTPKLFHKFLNNQTNSAEIELLLKYFGTAEEDELRQLISDELETTQSAPVANQELRIAAIHTQLTDQLFGTPKQTLFNTFWHNNIVKVAAMLIMVASISMLIYRFSQTENHAVLPGEAKAALTLNGTEKQLSMGTAAVLIKEHGVTISTRADGTIIYSADHADAAAASKINIVETPRGGEYRIALSDGSVVTLNSGSKLSFPTGFRGQERKVTLEGEAFFEVAKNPDRPFVVDIAGRSVRVLGTKFNLSNYEEEKGVIATLLEGGILFTDQGNHQIKLHPNQQVTSEAAKLSLRNVDASDFMAWTKGEFLFNDVPLATVMQKVARWYNVEFDATALPEKNLYLKISRKANISDLLKMVSTATALKFELQGNTILLKE